MTYESTAHRTPEAHQRRAPNAAKTATPAARPAQRPARAPIEIPLGMRILRVLSLAIFGGGMIAALLLMRAQVAPVILPMLAPTGYLLLSRVSAFVAYGLLWLSMALGLTITNKLARVWPGGPAAVDLHRYASLLGLAFAVFHVLVLLGAALGYTIDKALLPFAGSSYRPFWVGLVGKSSLYLMLIVALSFFVRARLGHRTWRALHYLSYVVFLFALIHGLFAGTDTPTFWAGGLYSTSALSLLGFTIYRVLTVIRARAERMTPTSVGPHPPAPAPKLGAGESRQRRG